jgi:hypothetical protein
VLILISFYAQVNQDSKKGEPKTQQTAHASNRLESPRKLLLAPVCRGYIWGYIFYVVIHLIDNIEFI